MNPFAYLMYRFRLWRNDRDTRRFNDYCWRLECREVEDALKGLEP